MVAMLVYPAMLLAMIAFTLVGIYIATLKVLPQLNLDKTRRQVQHSLMMELKLDNGTGCDLPKLNPFHEEIMQFIHEKPKFSCAGKDWVACHFSQCSVQPNIMTAYDSITCTYKDIIYVNDRKHYLGHGVKLSGDQKYELSRSDHVRVDCMGFIKDPTGAQKTERWQGVKSGFRPIAQVTNETSQDNETVNILVLAYDGVSTNQFIRKMPRSYSFLKEDLKAIFMKKHIIVGDGTTANIYAMLMGEAEVELPETRQGRSNAWVDHTRLLFYKLKQHGYRTAFFEDSPFTGTFTFRHNGFGVSPADHTLWNLMLENVRGRPNVFPPICMGDTPQYKFMLDKTLEFHEFKGKKFSFTFISDISHDDLNAITISDLDVVEFFKKLRSDGRLRNTMVFMMADHGFRASTSVLNTYYGRLEMRLPLMAIILPENLKQQRPEVELILQANSDVLTTHFDIYATILDAVNLRQYWKDMRTEGSHLKRSLTLLNLVPSSRSCSAAGVEPHWCVCHRWIPLNPVEPTARDAAQAVIHRINNLTALFRTSCEEVSLVWINYIDHLEPKKRMLQFLKTIDRDGYIATFTNTIPTYDVEYRMEIVVNPGNVEFTARFTYFHLQKQFLVDRKGITRISELSVEEKCIDNDISELCCCSNITRSIEGQGEDRENSENNLIDEYSVKTPSIVYSMYS